MGKFTDSLGRFVRDCAIACAPMVAEKTFNKVVEWQKKRDAEAKKLCDFDGLLDDGENKEAPSK